MPQSHRVLCLAASERQATSHLSPVAAQHITAQHRAAAQHTHITSHAQHSTRTAHAQHSTAQHTHKAADWSQIRSSQLVYLGRLKERQPQTIPLSISISLSLCLIISSSLCLSVFASRVVALRCVAAAQPRRIMSHY
jgi:delta 1-pyrroline-5-carboxylate dehydrogenase